MTDINYSIMLRHLVDDYFDHRLSRVEYLAQRRSLFDRIDHEFNGDVESNGWPEPESSQPQDHENDDTSRTVARETPRGGRSE